MRHSTATSYGIKVGIWDLVVLRSGITWSFQFTFHGAAFRLVFAGWSRPSLKLHLHYDRLRHNGAVSYASVIGPSFEAFISEVESLVESDMDERALTGAVATQLSTLLAGPFDLPPEFTRPHPDRYVMYPLHIDARGRFSIAAAVWDVGQKTPVHSHETWGVVGIYSGIEGESRYVKPRVDGEPLVLDESGLEWGPGQVSVCCVQEDDVHMVECVGDAPCVGIHVYGSDIGTLSRRAYDPVTGDVRWFISQWEPVAS